LEPKLFVKFHSKIQLGTVEAFEFEQKR